MDEESVVYYTSNHLLYLDLNYMYSDAYNFNRCHLFPKVHKTAMPAYAVTIKKITRRQKR